MKDDVTRERVVEELHGWTEQSARIAEEEERLNAEREAIRKGMDTYLHMQHGPGPSLSQRWSHALAELAAGRPNTAWEFILNAESGKKYKISVCYDSGQSRDDDVDMSNEPRVLALIVTPEARTGVERSDMDALSRVFDKADLKFAGAFTNEGDPMKEGYEFQFKLTPDFPKKLEDALVELRLSARSGEIHGDASRARLSDIIRRDTANDLWGDLARTTAIAAGHS